MSHADGGHRRVRPTLSPQTGLLAMVACAAVLTAACSGSPSGVRPDGAGAAGSSVSPSPGSVSSPAAGKQATEHKQLAYSVCMGKHGVPGVPTALPNVTPDSASPSKGAHWNAAPAGGPTPGSPQWQAAERACQSLLPRRAVMTSG
jgi:hypothetical protein